MSVGNHPSDIIISSDGTKAYVTNTGSNTVSVINTATNSVTTNVPVGDHPSDIAVTPDGTKVYVANWQGNTVSVIDTTTNTVVSTVPVGITPLGVALTPDGTKAYVTNAESDNISVIDTATNVVIATVNAGKYSVNYPTKIAIGISADSSRGKQSRIGYIPGFGLLSCLICLYGGWKLRKKQ